MQVMVPGHIRLEARPDLYIIYPRRLDAIPRVSGHGWWRGIHHAELPLSTSINDCGMFVWVVVLEVDAEQSEPRPSS